MLTRAMPHGTIYTHPQNYMNLKQMLYSKESNSQSKLILKKIYMPKFLIPYLGLFQLQYKTSPVFNLIQSNEL